MLPFFVSFSFISCEMSSTYNGHKDKEFACVAKFEICNYYSRGHWLLSNISVTTINLIVAMKVETNPLLMGVKHLTSLMWKTNSWVEIRG
jgi:hypothetical protein